MGGGSCASPAVAYRRRGKSYSTAVYGNQATSRGYISACVRMTYLTKQHFVFMTCRASENKVNCCSKPRHEICSTTKKMSPLAVLQGTKQGLPPPSSAVTLPPLPKNEPQFKSIKSWCGWLVVKIPASFEVHQRVRQLSVITTGPQRGKCTARVQPKRTHSKRKATGRQNTQGRVQPTDS